MTPLWTARDVAAATGGVARGAADIQGVAFDSREVRAGDLFIALAGQSSDGHAYVEAAFERGAVAALVQQPMGEARPHILVSDTMAALQALGIAARARTAARICGVTGSAGKTGVKEALRLALDRYRPGLAHASVKSYNNHTGVPLSLARMPAECRFGVFEMGMNHAGELAALTRLVRPHVAVITTIASAHVGNFPDGEIGVANAKAEIFQGLEPEGVAILPADSPHHARLRSAAERHAWRILNVSVEQTTAEVHAERIARHPTCTTLTANIAGERLTFKIGMPGDHWVANALAVLAAVHAMEGDLGLAGLALSEMEALDGRGRRSFIPLKSGGAALLIDESYNANPASMAATLAVLGGLRPSGRGRRIAVLGAMKELGEQAPALHAALAGPIAAAEVDIVVGVGAETATLLDALPPRAARVDAADASAALDWLKRSLRADDVLLVKGSNSVGLGRVVAGLRNQQDGEM